MTGRWTFLGLLCWSLSAVALAGAGASSPERSALWTSGKAPGEPPKFEDGSGFITVHRPAKPNGAAMIICPGGSYGGLMREPEGHGIARWLNQYGITGIVLEYRLPQGRANVPLLDAQRAIRLVRSKAKEWGVDPHRVGIIGFSAGGHLAATAATHFGKAGHDGSGAVDKLSCRPDFAILVYPVVTMGEKTHQASKDNLLGKSPKADLVELYSNEKQVTAQTPPVFLAHAKDDTLVPPDNSRRLYEALQADKVPAQYLELPSGGHGLNGYKGPMWDAWQTESLKWLAAQKMLSAGESGGEQTEK
mgnify:CR=1 FL=1